MRDLKTVLRAFGPMVLAVLILTSGCDKGESTNAESTPSNSSSSTAATMPIIPVVQLTDWCPEHAMPESICVQCNPSLAADYKARGDWCEEHNVPKSQDFAHHPELKAKFAAAFKEKHGKEPPAGGEHDHHDHDHDKE